MSVQARGRELEIEGGRWLAIEAWRGAAGHGICYFLRLDEGTVAEDDREDRRAPLEPSEEVASLETDRLESLWTEAVALTVTERRLTDPDGDLWLVQSSGPVWAREGGAAGLTGLVFTRLDGTGERLRPSGEAPAELTKEELLARLAGARSRTEGAPDDDR